MSSYFWNGTNETNETNETNDELKNSVSESELSTKNLLECFENETNITSCFSDPELHTSGFLDYISEVKKDTKSEIFVVMIDGEPVKYTQSEKEASDYIFNETKETLIDLNTDINNNYYLQIIDNDHINIISVPKFSFIKYDKIEESYKYFKIESL